MSPSRGAHWNTHCMLGTLLGAGYAKRKKRIIKDETCPKGADSLNRHENKHIKNYVIEYYGRGSVTCSGPSVIAE